MTNWLPIKPIQIAHRFVIVVDIGQGIPGREQVARVQAHRQSRGLFHPAQDLVQVLQPMPEARPLARSALEQRPALTSGISA